MGELSVEGSDELDLRDDHVEVLLGVFRHIFILEHDFKTKNGKSLKFGCFIVEVDCVFFSSLIIVIHGKIKELRLNPRGRDFEAISQFLVSHTFVRDLESLVFSFPTKITGDDSYAGKTFI